VFPDAWRGIHLPPLPKEERKSRSRKKEKQPWLTSIMSLFR
jgi:hypothetical protein